MEVLLRPWNLDDINSLVKHGNNKKIADNLTNHFPHPYTYDDAVKFIEMVSSAKPINVFAIEYKNEAIGAIGIFPQQDIYCRNAEMGYWISEDYWGKGIITYAISKMIVYAFDTFEINRIYARPFGPNLGSQKVLEKNGFELNARIKNSFYKNGEYLDELIYSRYK